MTDRRHHFRVGAFALATGALVAIVVFVFGGVHFWTHRDHYYVEFDDSVIGLETGAVVYLNGIQVGSVTGMKIAPTNLSKVRVEIAVESGTPVRRDTHAYLSFAGITGLKEVDLRGGSLQSPAATPDSAIVAGLGTLDKLEKRAEMLADESGRLMETANQVVMGANRVMANLSAISEPQEILAIVHSTRTASANLAEASAAVKTMVAENRESLKQSLDSIATATRSASTIMDTQVAGLVGNANSLIGDLRGVVHGNESTLQSAMADFRQASRTFKDLARELHERPSRLLFSSEQPERKLP